MYHTAFGESIHNLKVVVVDDCKPAQTILKQILFPIGFSELRFFTDARVAFKEMRASPPDLLITDWIMPQFDGQELIKRIRHRDNQRLCRMPVIVLTGLATHHMLCLGAILGVQAFVSKPISTARMRDVIKATLRDERKFFLAGDHYYLEETQELLSRVLKEQKYEVGSEADWGDEAESQDEEFGSVYEEKVSPEKAVAEPNAPSDRKAQEEPSAERWEI